MRVGRCGEERESREEDDERGPEAEHGEKTELARGRQAEKLKKKV